MSDTPTYPFRYKEEDIRREIQPRYGVRYVTPPEYRNVVNMAGFAFFNGRLDVILFRDALNTQAEFDGSDARYEAYNIETGQVIQ